MKFCFTYLNGDTVTVILQGWEAAHFFKITEKLAGRYVKTFDWVD